MNFTSTRLPYRQTNAFTRIALDYIDQADSLKSFYSHPPTLKGIEAAIDSRKKFKTDRTTLVDELKKQYTGIQISDKVSNNIDALSKDNCFTITTAHQNNIFTGPLYFIYKIVHAIRLADQLNDSFKKYQFVPVFYIGTEDADLEELNHIYLGDEKLSWKTKQTGAVGRMKVDKDLIGLINRVEGQLSVLPHGKEIVLLFRKYYKEGSLVQDATFGLVNELFSDYGLIILLPDKRALKSQMIKIFEDDLLNQTASGLVEKSSAGLEAAGYKVQAHPREINLFYLLSDKRERIVKADSKLLTELKDHPERFSPNVILRGIYQETILPSIAFIGGAGETAYWLQLKSLFEHYSVPFPVLVLRNSFLVVEKKWKERIAHLGLNAEDFFKEEEELFSQLIQKISKQDVKLNGSLEDIEKIYSSLKKQATAIDSSLEKHVEALKTKVVYRLQELEKKMLRAEKRKFIDQRRQVHSIKEHLFPLNSLQERHDTISYYYALFGKEILRTLLTHSQSLEQEFVVLTEL